MRAADPAAWRARLNVPCASALYLHVPFCVQKCAYCDFASWATPTGDPLMAAYVHALLAQLEEVAGLGLLDGCETAYVGGGTPSLLGAESLGGLVGGVRRAAPGVLELTCEANPDSLGDDVLAALVGAGATRLSLGVQSLDDDELSELGRVHDAATARDRVAAAVASGLDVSCDLMCAIPRQTDASWARTLAGVLALGVGHVSVYPLAIEEGTELARRVGDDDCPWNDGDVQAARMRQAAGALEAAGLSRYEVASYARSGRACRHNEAYWTGRAYLGLGTGASGMLTRAGYLRLCEACPQLPAPPADAARMRLAVTSGREQIATKPRLRDLGFSLEFLTEAQAAAEDLMLGARLVAGLDSGLVAHARDVLGAAEVDATLEGLLADGYLEERDVAADGGAAGGAPADGGAAGGAPADGGAAETRLAPTDRGWLLGNELYARLWALAPGHVTEAQC